MDYEKKYKEALERAKDYFKANQKIGESEENDVLSDIFPELKESEDELALLKKYIEEEAYFLSMDIRDNEDRIKLKNLQRSLAWLEKQGQKSINDTDEDIVEVVNDTSILDMVESKSKTGDQLENQGGIDNYPLECSTNTVMTDSKKNQVKPKFKVGDVLCDKSCTTLNKESQPNFEITDIRNGMYICDKCSFPISQQDEYELVAKRIEQKPWSEEDEVGLSDALWAIEQARTIAKDENDMGNLWYAERWIKSLKQRIEE